MVAALAAGCRDSIAALDESPSGSDAAERAEEVFAALGARVTNPWRDAKYDSARTKIANAAMLPSRVWDDTAVWTSATPTRRTLLIAGAFDGTRYRLVADPDAPAPDSPADSRHVIHLTRLSDDEYAWDTDVLYAVGSVRARDVGALFRALFSTAEGRAERGMRADYQATIPTAAAVLGQLFRVDSIATTHLRDSSTLATFALTVTPEGVEERFPNFARYMRNYAGTARMHWTLTDRQGGTFLSASMRDGHIALRVRTRNGVLVPLAGPARPMPDSLRLNGDLTIRVRRFTVGFHDYHADFTITRGPRMVGFEIASREEPGWVLPLITEHLLNTPLKRPFAGDGASFGMSVRDTSGAQTILLRSMHLVVEESLILRFIGRLTSTAIADWQGKAEREQMTWLEEVFDALVADVRRLR